MKLHYLRLGESSRALCILHGLFGSLDNWMTLGRQFSQYYSVYLIDARNHGRSPWCDTMNYEVMAEDLQEFITEHRLERPFVLGHSMGGKTLMQWALRFPDKAAKIIVADIAPRAYPPAFNSILMALEELHRIPLTSRQQAEAILRQHISEEGIVHFLAKNLYWNENNQLVLRFNLEVIRQQLPVLSGAIDPVGQCKVPALFLRGEYSHYIEARDEEEIKKLFPLAKFSTVPGAGHWVHAENPRAFFALCYQFLEK